MTISKRIVSAVSFAVCTALVLFSGHAMEAARQGLELWWNNVLPALFPFFVCATLIQSTGVLNGNGRFFKSLARLFGLPPSALPTMLVSAVSGTPTGARLCGKLMEAGAVSEPYAQLMAALFNFCSPLFITGTICVSMLKDPRLTVPILAGHYLSSLILFAILSPIYLRQQHKNHIGRHQAQQKAFQPLNALTGCIADGMQGMLKIGGTIVLFMVLTAMLEYTGVLNALSFPFEHVFRFLGLNPAAVKPLLTGIMELTNGCHEVAAAGLSLREEAAACAFLASFGGLCILAQSMSFMDINVIKYIGFKALNGIAAGVITFFMVPLTVQNAAEAFLQYSIDEWQNNAAVGLALLTGAFIGITASVFFSAALKQKIRETRLNRGFNTNGRRSNGRVPLQ